MFSVGFAAFFNVCLVAAEILNPGFTVLLWGCHPAVMCVLLMWLGKTFRMFKSSFACGYGFETEMCMVFKVFKMVRVKLTSGEIVRLINLLEKTDFTREEDRRFAYEMSKKLMKALRNSAASKAKYKSLLAKGVATGYFNFERKL